MREFPDRKEGREGLDTKTSSSPDRRTQAQDRKMLVSEHLAVRSDRAYRRQKQLEASSFSSDSDALATIFYFLIESIGALEVGPDFRPLLMLL